MASAAFKRALTLLLIVMLSHRTTAQSGCSSALVGLAPCLNYVQGSSSTPSSSCCSQLASIVQSQPECLCQLFNGGGSSVGVTINQTLALALPGACNVQTPPVSRCNGNAANGPATSPADAPFAPPSDSSDETPDTPNSPSLPTIPSGGGSKTDKTTQGTSNASIKAWQLHLSVFLVFIASFAFKF